MPAQTGQLSTRIVETSPLAIVALDAGGNVVLWNPAAERLFGWGASEVLGRPVPLVAEDQRDPFNARITGIPGKETGGAVELRCLRKDGSPVDVSVWVAPLSSGDGEVVGIVGILADISARRQREQAVRDKEARYRQIVETANEGIWIVDGENTITFVNLKMAEMLGYAPQEMIGHSMFDFMDADAGPVAAGNVERRRSGIVEQHDFRFRRKDGSVLWSIVAATPITDGAGQYRGTLGMVADITGRKLAEEELRKRESLLNEAQQVGNFGCWEWDIAADRVFASDQLYVIYGVSPERFGGTADAYLEFVHPKDRELVRAAIQHALSSREPFDFEQRIVRPDGAIRILQNRGKAFHDADGRPLRVLGICVDVTDRKRTQEALHESEARVRAFSNHSPALMFVKDPKGRYLDVNPRFEKMFGLTRRQIIGKTDHELFEPEQAAAFRAHDLQVLQAGAALEFEEAVRSADGLHTRIVAKFPLRDTQGRIYAIGGIATDITERRRTEIALRDSQERLQALFDNTRDGIMLADSNARHVDANPALCQLLGYSREEMLGMILWDIIPLHLRQEVHELWSRFLAAGRLEGEFTCLRKDGTTVDVEYRAVAQFMPGLHLCTVRDITERKRAEAGLKNYAEHMKLLSRRLVELQESERRLMARELHDRIGQNLTAINLHLSMIREQLAPDTAGSIRHRVEDSIALVDETVEAVRNVMADLRPAVLEDCGLLAGLQWYAEVFSKRAGVAIAVSGTESSPRLPRTAEDALFRIAQEAFVNVVKHANATRIELTLESTPEVVRLAVADDGCGFDPAAERGASTRSGWGLMTMQERVEAVGGSLRVDSAPGRGTRIVAEVPGS